MSESSEKFFDGIQQWISENPALFWPAFLVVMYSLGATAWKRSKEDEAQAKAERKRKGLPDPTSPPMSSSERVVGVILIVIFLVVLPIVGLGFYMYDKSQGNV